MATKQDKGKKPLPSTSGTVRETVSKFAQKAKKSGKK